MENTHFSLEPTELKNPLENIGNFPLNIEQLEYLQQLQVIFLKFLAKL